MPPASEQTKRVLQHHLHAADSGDIDLVLSDYAPDALLFTPEGPKRGHEQIRPAMQWLLANIFTADCEFKMIQQLVDGEIAYIVWTAETPHYRVSLATDTYLVRNGKIAVQTFAAKVEQKNT